jgi:hypothetical protein
MLVDLKWEVSTARLDDNMAKNDLCDIVDARITQIIKQFISAPYCNNFSFEIDRPPEQDQFDRAALLHMEMCDERS